MDKKELIERLRDSGFSYAVLRAIEEVERKDFIEEKYKEKAYEDRSLPIEGGQSIAQPQTIALMLDLLKLKDRDRILEVGCGSGYVLALLSKICPNSKIYGIERIKELKELSDSRLKKIENVTIFHGDGNLGYKMGAPYDKILVSATGEGVPRELLQQLKTNGIMVLPIAQSIYKIKKTETGLEKEEFPGFSFVPLRKGLERGNRAVWKSWEG